MKYFFLLFLLAFTVSHSQTYKVNLTSRTALDDNGFHISAFYDNPKEELLLSREELSRVWVLRKLLNEMNIIEGMEFLLEKMRETKNNKDFLRAMNM